MMRTLSSVGWATAVLATARIAAADPRSVLVLKAEGTADAAARDRIEAAVFKLAKNIDGNVVLGEITYTDAAAATGCKPSEASCRDEVMTTLSVDEIVIATVTPAGADVHVDVKRAAKGQPARESTVTLATSDTGDVKIETAIGPMFGVKPKPAVTPPAPVPPTPVPPPQVVTSPQPKPDEAPPAPTTPQPAVTAAPNNTVEPPPPADHAAEPEHHRLLWAGVIGGGAFVLLGVGLWAAANATESEIQSAPTSTSADITKLRNLENQGDGQAGGGNLFFVTGVVLGGITGFLLWRDHRHAGTQAQLAPMAGAHVAGLSLTIGGQP